MALGVCVVLVFFFPLGEEDYGRNNRSEAFVVSCVAEECHAAISGFS